MHWLIDQLIHLEENDSVVQTRTKLVKGTYARITPDKNNHTWTQDKGIKFGFPATAALAAFDDKPRFSFGAAASAPTAATSESKPFTFGSLTARKLGMAVWHLAI